MGEGSRAVSKTDALGRQVWDKAAYATLAAEKARTGEVAKQVPKEETEKARLRREKRERLNAKAPKERTFLEGRTERLKLETKLGTQRFVNAADDAAIGFHCATCECTLKDSAAYMDHLNGKRHNRLLGKSMRVERKDADQVKDRLKALKQKKLTSLTP
ncbi:putative C2H2 type zinc-finger protein [Gregarina niphandrodes]|uniref:C2H2 type zinc-finger protein n=1 Tax=Gregarina niphandrodes TaxID=110365 RepID=A0A023AXV6_GRENI|nr:putative C2H2 type zinc-finger protein [Gregarina niphandrodes]EZG43487.1 putative C2H2 type zinc-finger protein [Gregarina niphandrodes]|eukprot:XP_011133286.1 putative C2H2 type zinc-finger protein [Gregarina niphandrodes]